MSVDINDKDFVKNFKIEDATVGVVGHGFVGKATDEFFRRKTKVLVHDKVKPELQTLDEVVAGSEIIFICVPTPMRKDGSCHTGFVEEVISNIRDTAKKIERSVSDFIVVVKSTVYPGFTEEMQNKFLPMRIAFSPEYLTEANASRDFIETNRIVVGADEDDGVVICKYFFEMDPKRCEHEDPWKRRHIMLTDSTTAELVKLYANGILATKVMFSNEMYQICQKLGVTYDDVRTLACLDNRIGAGHTLVAPDGLFGFGKSCFRKDLNNLKFFAKSIGVEERLFSAVLARNDELRQVKDGEELKNRAFIDE